MSLMLTLRASLIAGYFGLVSGPTYQPKVSILDDPGIRLIQTAPLKRKDSKPCSPIQKKALLHTVCKRYHTKLTYDFYFTVENSSP